jgi:hypothetical protein
MDIRIQVKLLGDGVGWRSQEQGSDDLRISQVRPIWSRNLGTVLDDL